MLKDWKLAVGVLILVITDFIILIIYTCFEDTVVGGVEVELTSNKENPSRSEGVWHLV